MVVDEYRLIYSEETGLNVPTSALFMVFLTVFLDSLSSTITNPVLPYYALAFGVSTAALGYLYASFALAGFFGTPLLGRLSDAYGRRAVLILTLVGGGVASLGQAASPCFMSLLAFRAFAGIWGAVLPIAQVYLGDICSYAVLASHMAKLSQVPAFSRTMGPGLGGGLSKFGLEIPILVNGVVSLVTAALVFVYVPETPTWLATQTEAAEEAAAQAADRAALAEGAAVRAGVGADSGPGRGAPRAGAGKGRGKGRGKGKGKDASAECSCSGPVRVPWTAYGLGTARLFFAMQMGMQVSMMAVSMKAKFDWDPLRVGYALMSMSLVGLCTGIWISPRVSNCIGTQRTANLGGLLASAGLLGLGLAESVASFMSFLALNKVGMGLWQAMIGTLGVSLSVPSNRGRVFSTIGMFQKVGATVGPIAAGHIADVDPERGVWFAAAAAGLVSATILFSLRLPSVAAGHHHEPLLRGYSDLPEMELEDEVGSAEDYADLGQFLGGLLSARHYRWVSRREQVYEMLDMLLPEVNTDGAQHKLDLEQILEHAAGTRLALQHVRARSPPRRFTLHLHL